MNEERTPYTFLIHCSIHQIREGFEANIRKLPFEIETRYTDLLKDGIASELKCSPHLIVVLQHECDSDYLLPLKIKLFARNYPILMVSPAMPDGYYHFLKIIGVEHIVQLPADDEVICDTISGILE